MTQGRQEQYWDGATWLYSALVTNDGDNSGTHTYAVVPGTGNELEIIGGFLENRDSAGRTGNAIIDETAGGTAIARLIGENESIAAGVERHYGPTATTATTYLQGDRIKISGSMEITFGLSAVAVSLASRFTMIARIRGAIPTVTITSPTGATEAIEVDVVV